MAWPPAAAFRIVCDPRDCPGSQKSAGVTSVAMVPSKGGRKPAAAAQARVHNEFEGTQKAKG